MIKQIRYFPIKIFEKIGNNAFRLDFPPYMKIYSVVSVEKLRLYEPPMIDDHDENFRFHLLKNLFLNI